MPLHLTTLLVHAYDPAITFFTQSLGFTLTSDEPALTNDGKPKRWVVVTPPSSFQSPAHQIGNTADEKKQADGSATASGSGPGILLAQASTPAQAALVGKQFADRVGLFWRVGEGVFWGVFERLKERGVEILGEPRREEYGLVVVFRDCLGNKWDLLGD
ncbi:hypothetical protein BJY04DRAFT_217737 [Aspergillus karnatakaensis]|uniref:uncharacterized protein n=1 Tax=Aspergillus karnatakaensis TaxID=1810916 RepID=UPI003CCD63E8